MKRKSNETDEEDDEFGEAATLSQISVQMAPFSYCGYCRVCTNICVNYKNKKTYQSLIGTIILSTVLFWEEKDRTTLSMNLFTLVYHNHSNNNKTQSTETENTIKIPGFPHIIY